MVVHGSYEALPALGSEEAGAALTPPTGQSLMFDLPFKLAVLRVSGYFIHMSCGE